MAGQGPSRRKAGDLVAVVLLALAAASIAFVQPRLVQRFRAVKNAADVYTLPPADAMPAFSLGYRAALADFLFTSTLVQYGIHGEEHRRFDTVGDYLDAVVTLDPNFCSVYRYADTLIIYHPAGTPTADDVRHARRLVEMGLAHCPDDGRLWLSAGQFMAFIATQFLTDERDKQEFRTAGARALSRAAELVTDNPNVQWQALAAAGIFSREGQREAAIAFLERVYSVTDDEELRDNIGKKLVALRQEGAVDLARRRSEAINEVWRRDVPFVSRTRMLVLGPPRDVSACAGKLAYQPERSCAAGWGDWLGSPE